MKAKVLGWAHKQGEYNGFKYDNFVLHVATKNMNVSGTAVEQIKVKAPVFSNFLLESDVTENELIGRTIDLQYGRHDALESIELLDD